MHVPLQTALTYLPTKLVHIHISTNNIQRTHRLRQQTIHDVESWLLKRGFKLSPLQNKLYDILSMKSKLTSLTYFTCILSTIRCSSQEIIFTRLTFNYAYSFL